MLGRIPVQHREPRGDVPAIVALGAYGGLVRTAILNVKFRNRREAGRQLGILLGGRLSLSADVIVPVPLHARRLAERGFNQAAAIAAGIASVLRLPVMEALERVRHTAPQSALELDRRISNVAGAFVPLPALDALRGRHVLLVDDVVTSGTTIAQCARALRAAGVLNIEAVALALKL